MALFKLCPKKKNNNKKDAEYFKTCYSQVKIPCDACTEAILTGATAQLRPRRFKKAN